MKKNKKNTPTAEQEPLRFSRKGIWGWVCVMLLICGWMFFIGVLVGRGTAPLKFDIPQIADQLKSSLGGSQQDGKNSVSGQGARVKNGTELEFYEDLKKNRTDGDSLKLQDATAFPRENEAASKPAAAVTEKPDQPGVGPSSEKTVSRSASAGEAGSYTVQVASVRNAKDADRLVEKLQKAGYPAYRGIGKVPGRGIWYRVRVGQYASRIEAQKVLEQLKKDGQKPILLNVDG